MNPNHIYVNPSFASKSNTNIHINPSFVNRLRDDEQYMKSWVSNSNLPPSTRKYEEKGNKIFVKPQKVSLLVGINNRNSNINMPVTLLQDNQSKLKSDSISGSLNASISTSERNMNSHMVSIDTKSYQGCELSLKNKFAIPVGKFSHIKKLSSSYSDEKTLNKNEFNKPAQYQTPKYVSHLKNSSCVTLHSYVKPYYAFSSHKTWYKQGNVKFPNTNQSKYSLDKRNNSIQNHTAVKKDLKGNDTQKPSQCYSKKVMENKKFSLINTAETSLSLLKRDDALKKIQSRNEKTVESKTVGKRRISKEFTPQQSSSMKFINNSMQVSKPTTTEISKKNGLYTLTSKRKLVRNINIDKFLAKKNSFALKTKTKLIRRNSLNSRFRKYNNNVSSPRLLLRNTYLKKTKPFNAKESIYKKSFNVSQRNSSVSKESKFRTKYKLINMPCVTTEVSRARASFKCTKTFKSHLQSRNKRNLKKSDKFINIEGNLYKSTGTSLKKQLLPSLKTKKGKEFPTVKVTTSRKFSASGSKFVYKRQSSTDLQSGTLIEIVRRKKLSHFKRVNDFCFFYNKYGKCKKEKKGCPFIHDPKRIAICTRYLGGSCTVTDCRFSHTLDRNRMPVCSHFLEGSCHRETCPYRHVRVNPEAPLCRNFLKGYCPKGEECKNKHILICEEYKKDGVCPRGKSCPLSHRKRKSSKSQSQKRRRKSSSSSSLTDSSSKKGKKSAHQRKPPKIGVLGLDLEKKRCSRKASKETELLAEDGVSSSVKGRYFNYASLTSLRTDDVTGLKAVAVETSHEVTPIDTSPEKERGSDCAELTSDWEDKRMRLLQKIEKLKKNYHVGNFSHPVSSSPGMSGNKTENTSTVFSKLPNEINDTGIEITGPGESVETDRKNRAPGDSVGWREPNTPLRVTSPEPSVGLRFLPLPDVMPAFIPLVMPEERE